MTVHTFGFHIITVAKIVEDVCCVVACKLAPKYVNLPQAKNVIIEKVVDFEERYSIHKAFEYIGGTDVAIIRPPERSHDYFLQTVLHCHKQAIWNFRGLLMDAEYQ